jgi:arsenate reductase (thioredoxin)
MKILILCTGNSCRSQMAHGFLKSFVPNQQVESAGTEPSPLVNPSAIEVMAELGVDISSHTPKHVDQFIDTSWDYVITVCGGAQETCPSFIGQVKNRMHIGFDDPSHSEGTSAFIRSEFCRVRDEIKSAFYQFYIKELKN